MSIWPFRGRASGLPSSAPPLRSLSPAYEEGKHGYYVSVLVDQLTRPGADAPRNVALTGHYGSGKSSVLVEVSNRINSLRFRRAGKSSAINISLSSLGADEARVGRVLDDRTPPLTNLIQKEIVKQLLYRERPDKMRGSRYRRTDTFHGGRAATWAVVIAASLTVVALLAGAIDTVRAALPASWADVSWAPWLATATLTAAGAVLCWFAARTLHNRVWIERLSAGPATVALQHASSSYFDEYLDEIVHFFQASGTTVVIFEDLDRFKDPHIFETLRELNTVLNNSQQIPHRPIRFVYAIKDSIFETLATEPDKPLTAEEQRNATTNRTKFFDLVVPIVPFISHRTAHGLVRAEFSDAQIRPSEQILEVIAPHLTDMRLVKNIRNEYDVFSRHILPPSGPEGLEADRLLAMLVYKNLHMGDHELVREGRSHLDALHRRFRDMVTTLTQQADDDARAARAAINTLDNVPATAEQLGRRLLDILDVLIGRGSTAASIQIGASSFQRDQVLTPEFWQEWAATRATIDASQGPYTRMDTRSAEEMETLLDVTLDVSAWDEERRAELELAEFAAISRRNEVSGATLHELMADPTATVEIGGGPVTLRTLAQATFDRLTVDLIAAGLLLDENYTLYVATFDTGVLSLRAMAFILHSIQPDVADLRFRFESPDEIAAVVAAEPRRLLLGQAVFNIDVVDYLLGHDPDALGPAAHAIAAGTPHGRALVDAYLLDGKHRAELVALLAPVWREVFTYLAGQDGLPDDDAVDLLAVAARHVRPEVVYEVDDAVRVVLRRLVTDADAFTDEGAASSPDALAGVLKSAGIRVERLDVLALRVREAVVARDLYEVSRDNLRTALGPDTPLTLEGIMSANTGVYRHVLRHLHAYLDDVLHPNDPTVSRAEKWLTVIADVASIAQEFVGPVAERADAALTVHDLTDAPEAAWEVLARTHRIAPTALNLATYLDQRGVDDALETYLRSTRAIDPVDAARDTVRAIALMLLNAAALPPKELVRLVATLRPPTLAVSELTEAAKQAVPELVRAGLISDVPENFAFLSGQPWELRAELVDASPGLSDYFMQIDLTQADLHDLATQPLVPPAVRAQILDNLTAFDDLLTPGSARALAEWALRHDHKVGVATLTLLAEHGAGARVIVSLLKPLLPELGASDIASVVTPLGAPYTEALTAREQARVLLPKTQADNALAKRLREL